MKLIAVCQYDYPDSILCIALEVETNERLAHLWDKHNKDCAVDMALFTPEEYANHYPNHPLNDVYGHVRHTHWARYPEAA